MNPQELISNFLKRSGAHIFNAMFLAKVIGFLISVSMARILTKADYGDFTYAFTIVSFLIPFIGFGAYQSLIYFGAELKTDTDKKELFKYSLSRGLVLSIILTLILIAIAPLVTKNQPKSLSILIILSFHIITFSLVEFVRNYSRLIDRNKIYASSENVYNIILLLSSITGAYLLNSRGYAIALVVCPLIVGLYYLKKLNVLSFGSSALFAISPMKFWKYGLFVSLGAVAAKMMYIVDIMTIGNFLQDSADIASDFKDDDAFKTFIREQVATYKVCSIIPIASFILPIAVLTTDFVKISESKTNKGFLNSYSISLIKILAPISIFIALVLHFGRDYILMIFGNQYEGSGELISVFSLAVIGAFCLRIPYGNLLSAVGKANWNAYISFAILAVNVILNYYMVIHYGIIGAAWTTTILIWLSGVLNLICFKFYSNSLSES